MFKYPTYTELKKHLKYDSETGLFYRRIASWNNAAKKGDVCNYISKDNGYVFISINNVQYRAHRLAWFYVHGYVPENDIDHKDRVGHHNWISNLREASHQCNIRNTGNFAHNTSGVKGVIWLKIEQKWRAQIKINQKKYITRILC